MRHRKATLHCHTPHAPNLPFRVGGGVDNSSPLRNCHQAPIPHFITGSLSKQMVPEDHQVRCPRTLIDHRTIIRSVPSPPPQPRAPTVKFRISTCPVPVIILISTDCIPLTNTYLLIANLSLALRSFTAVLCLPHPWTFSTHRGVRHMAGAQ